MNTWSVMRMEIALARWVTGASSARTFKIPSRSDTNERRDRKQKLIWSCSLTGGAAAALNIETHIQTVLGGQGGGGG